MVELGLAKKVLDASSAVEVSAICREHPEILDPSFAAALEDVERVLRGEGRSFDDTDGLALARLTLQSVREGRNLRASQEALAATTSLRVVRDLIAQEPLLLHPLFARVFEGLERTARHQGQAVEARSLAQFRSFLVDAAHRGANAAYFEVVVNRLTVGGQQVPDELDDLAGTFDRWLREELREAARLGNKERVDRLSASLMVMNARPAAPEPGDDQSDLMERLRHLTFLVLSVRDPVSWRSDLESHPRLLEAPVPALVAGSLESELMEFSLERDVLAARAHWRRRGLLLRCAEVGVEVAYDEWDRGAWWPQHVVTR